MSNIRRAIIKSIRDNDIETLKTFTVEQLNDKYFKCHHYAHKSDNNVLILMPIKDDYLDMVKTMIDIGCNMNDEFILFGVESIEMVKLLVDNIDKSLVYYLPEFILQSMECIELIYENDIKFVREGHIVEFSSVEVFRYIMAREENIDMTLKEGHTPLYYVARNRCAVEKAEILIELGAEVDKIVESDGCQRTALGIAISEEYFAMVEYLIKVGGDIHLKYPDGNSPKHHSHYNNMFPEFYVQLINLLLNNGFDINEKDLNDETYLLRSSRWCASYGAHDETYNEFINLMTELNADMLAKNNKNMNVLHCMFSHHKNCLRNEKIITNFVENGVDINGLDDNGNTFIHNLDYIRHKDILFLLDNGFDFNVGTIPLFEKIVKQSSTIYKPTDEMMELVLMNTSYEYLPKVKKIAPEHILKIIDKYTLKYRSKRTKSAKHNY